MPQISRHHILKQGFFRHLLENSLVGSVLISIWVMGDDFDLANEGVQESVGL